MSQHVGMLDLSPGAVVVVDGVEWLVESFAPQYGHIQLHRGDGTTMQTTVRALLTGPAHRAPVNALILGTDSATRQPMTLADLTQDQRELALVRLGHVLEVETGFRGGDPLRPAPGEPRRGYDPNATTLTARRLAKVAELQALDPQDARRLGFAHVSLRTLERLGADCRRFGVAGAILGSWVRRSGGRPSITEPVREAIFAVRAETLHRSRISMMARRRLVCQYVREKYDEQVQVPCYETLRQVWREWFGPGGARQRYQRSAAAVEATGIHVVVHRPGQVIALDTTILPVKVRESVFGDPVSAHLTIALDVYTHSLVAFRLTLVSDTSVDVAMLLRDVMTPLPLRDGWGEDMIWPYPGVPAAVVAEFAGYPVAALPFFTPETVTTDHGSVYKNHNLVEVQRVIGANILPARVLRPTDKQAVERAFGAIQSLLFENLLGYQGVDVADRGVDPEADAVLTVEAMEHLVATWSVKIWQNRVLGEYAPAWDPGGRHSPNTLFAAAMAQGGFALQIPTPELYYELLPAHHVSVHGRRGVKIRGLWYDGPGLDDYRHEPSTRGGVHKGKWVVRSDPRDRRTVFFHDPGGGQWHTLRWTGLPAEGEIPSFSDARARQLLEHARQAGLKPRSDAELLPLLLDLLSDVTPVHQWPTQAGPAGTGKRHRTEHAREATRAAAAHADRPEAPPAAEPGCGQDVGTVVPMRPVGRVAQVQTAVDAERRRRREAAVPDRPQPPPRLGDAFRRRSLFLLPADEPDEPGQAG
ncbi:DDE-type integrase/transposase/recombinase [Paractinoplanes rishiriensis]|uniref:Integrase catalytic domain-containing protein n=1 Tax=Paractinoplanes rishiriensis TaxID=1050105 RepID=A0A919JSA2_9ACTN|nr:DDE-type integrase/transposase/recombinase [Actinoplanes rishiriensis]GIE93915.1 hypothetical protein Ari01nite_13800 [Actinoplanes rishiriensis]